MAIFESSIGKAPSKKKWYVLLGVCIAGLIVLAFWLVLRFHAEKATVTHFLDTVAAGKMDDAYRIWKPSDTYSFKDFSDDWGPGGYYGPVKSFRIDSTDHTKHSSGVIITVIVSPDAHFPGKDDAAEMAKTKRVKLWVQFKDQSISYPPPEF